MTTIPDSCTVLIVGGGPGGSYTASALAREGVDTVVLEADSFPRYHIGESLLASVRYFLRFIDLETKFDQHGFTKKLGAAFKLNDKRESFTNFLAVNGPNGYAWNVVRSESDMIMFQHAADCGARTFDGTKVESIEFDSNEQPVSAKWVSRKDGSSGNITFDYLVDASGRSGLLSTKYLKSRKFNQGLKNAAQWAYWKGAKTYAPGSEREGQPFFEALDDLSGWCWSIPLHDGTLSVGIVMRQEQQVARKRAAGSPSMVEFYTGCLDLAPIIKGLLTGAEMVTGIKAASDWSYSASTYSGPNFRIVGDAGCFIDPFFSSGLHLAMSSGLSAALTIQAARRGDCDEATAAKWHSAKVAEGYTRFLLVVMMALKQIRKGDEPVLGDFDQDSFDKAFGFFTPIIQGLADADVSGELTQSRVSETVDFCLRAYHQISPVDREAVLDKVAQIKNNNPDKEDSKEDLDKLTEEELTILRTIRARQMMRTEDTLNMDNFSKDVIEGLVPRLKLGELGLSAFDPREHDAAPRYKTSLMDVRKRVDVNGSGNGGAGRDGIPDKTSLPRIVDMHHHILPEEFLKAHGEAGSIPTGLKTPQWTPELDMAFMDHHHVKTAIVSMAGPALSMTLGIKEAAAQARRSNLACAELVTAHPSRYRFFASLPLGSREADKLDIQVSLSELGHALDHLGADGITLMTSYNGKYLGDQVFRPLWAELDRRQAVVLIHPAAAPSAPLVEEMVPDLPPHPIIDFPHETTRCAVQLIVSNTTRDFPNVKIILSHGGGTLPFVATRIAHLSADAGLLSKMTAEEFLDEAKRFYFDTALTGFSGPLESLVKFAREGHVLWGSDFPFVKGGALASQMEHLDGLEEAVRRLVECGAALELFPRLAGV
ncbi:hypothetical protein V8F06_012510 [Rhypophila decipiens]